MTNISSNFSSNNMLQPLQYLQVKDFVFNQLKNQRIILATTWIINESKSFEYCFISHH
jgi:hypothetical protein